MKRLGTLDASWLAVESEDTPMHVGTLQIFSLPEGAPETFLRDMVTRMKEAGGGTTLGIQTGLVRFPRACDRPGLESR
jgi:hypothetical protein